MAVVPPTKDANPIGYTRPAGTSLLAERIVGLNSTYQLARYSLTGHLEKILATLGPALKAEYSPNGESVAVGDDPPWQHVAVVSNAGGVARRFSRSDSCGLASW